MVTSDYTNTLQSLFMAIRRDDLSEKQKQKWKDEAAKQNEKNGITAKGKEAKGKAVSKPAKKTSKPAKKAGKEATKAEPITAAQDPDSKKWLVKGTKFVLKSNRNKVIVGKLRGGKVEQEEKETKKQAKPTKGKKQVEEEEDEGEEVEDDEEEDDGEGEDMKFEDMTVKELRERAKARGLSGYSKKNKACLVELLRSTKSSNATKKASVKASRKTSKTAKAATAKAATAKTATEDTVLIYGQCGDRTDNGIQWCQTISKKDWYELVKNVIDHSPYDKLYDAHGYVLCSYLKMILFTHMTDSKTKIAAYETLGVPIGIDLISKLNFALQDEPDTDIDLKQWLADENLYNERLGELTCTWEFEHFVYETSTGIGKNMKMFRKWIKGGKVTVESVDDMMV